MAKVLRYAHIAERTLWPEEVPSADLLLIQSPDGTTGVDVWWLEEADEIDD